MNKASSRRATTTATTTTTTTSREKCISAVRRLVRYFLRDFPFISRLAHSRERYCPRRFPLIFHAHAVKMEIHFNALFTARVPFYVRANNSDDQFALPCRMEQIGFEIKNFWSKISWEKNKKRYYFSTQITQVLIIKNLQIISSAQ